MFAVRPILSLLLAAVVAQAPAGSVERRSPPLGLDLYMPIPEENPLTAEKIELGRRLFFDRRLSRDGLIACSSCHDPERAFSDGRPVAVGVFGRQGRRHAPAIINRGYGRAFFWDGRARSLEEQVLKPIQDRDEMDLALDEASSRVNLDSAAIAGALASYVRSILSGDSPYDRFVNGERTALSPEQQLGLQVFRGKGNCTACHVGPNFSDEKLHNTGIAWRRLRPLPSADVRGSSEREDPASAEESGGLVDLGRSAVTGKDADRGAFKTPTLREVARTAPYMHDGSFATLEDVVDYYDRGGNSNPGLDPELKPLYLTPEDKQALIAFLRSLSGRISEGWSG